MSAAGNADERVAWIGLASTPGVGDLTFQRLLECYGSASEALRAVSHLSRQRADRELASALGTRLRRDLAAAIAVTARDPARPVRRAESLGGWTLMPLDETYPPRLHELEFPPAVLFGLGDVGALVRTCSIAVVGTRRPTAVGRDLATRVGRRLAEAGATVVSGLALGIDGAAHLGALEAGGDTVAVVGGGLDEPGPWPHRRLARDIARSGALISELAPGVRPTQGTFPRRNRIISALSTTTIVVEAPARSGALITARHALEQGRGLLVAPGRPLDPRVAGNLALLRESPARPLTGLDDMIVDLGLDSPGEPSASEDAARAIGLSATAALGLLAGGERAVARALCAGPQTTDGICTSTGLGAGVVAAALTMLQLRGWVRVHGAMNLPAGPLLGADARGAA